MDENQQASFDAWCIVEILGRKVVAGRVTEQVIAGQGFIRVDVPAVKDQAGFTQMYGPGSIYAITPTTEEIARAFAARNVGAPIQPYQLALPETVRDAPIEEMGERETHEGDRFFCRECKKFVPASRWDLTEDKCVDCAAPF